MRVASPRGRTGRAAGPPAVDGAGDRTGENLWIPARSWGLHVDNYTGVIHKM